MEVYRGGKLIANSLVYWQAHETHPNGHSINRSLPSWTLLAVFWQMCHVWITYRMSSGAVLMMDKFN